MNGNVANALINKLVAPILSKTAVLRVKVLIINLVATIAAFGATYRVQDIENVHVMDSTRFVSNTDGILSDETVRQADRILHDIRRGTTAEAVLVIVDDIEGGDIDGFATDLFTEWGLGKSDKDNGLLILVAKDLRRAAIRPGYGLEGVLPDITCGRILRNDMFPNFKNGDYDAGVLAALRSIESILTDPEVAEEIRSAEADADFRPRHADDEDLGDFFKAYFAVAAFGALLMLVLMLVLMRRVNGRSLHDKYVTLNKLKPIYLALTFVGLGVPAIASVPLVIKLRRWRNTPRKCPRCESFMTKVDEVHDNDYLKPTQDTEERIGSVDYDVWLCPKCSETDIEAYETPGSGYLRCEKCGGKTAKYYRTRILRQPTTLSSGRGEKEYRCAHCGHLMAVSYIIPKIIVVSGGGGGSHGGGGFGGGFGGGRTGGGGASGGW